MRPIPSFASSDLPNGKKVHLLPATLETTQWGWFDNAQAPVLRVKSGDTIVLETMMHSHNQVVPGTTIEQIKKTRTDFPGRGPHTLTGPIYIEEAQPGDVLKVTLNKIVPRSYATNFNVPGMFGQFPSVYQDGQVKYLYLDLDKHDDRIPARRRTAAAAVPRHASVSRARIRDATRACRRENSPATWISATSSPARSLYVPVHVPGALLWTGDSHAGQGNGEVNLTAIETAYKEFNITVEVIKGKPLDFPRIETAKSWITMGFDPGLNKAWAQAKAQTVKFLSEQRSIPRRTSREIDGERFRLPCLAGRQRQERHPLPQSKECARQGGHGTPDQRDVEIPSLARQGRRPEQGDERSLDGHDQAARVGEEDCPARRLWARQRGDGLPGRGDLRHREECPLPDAEEHLGRGRQALTKGMEGLPRAALPHVKSMVLRFAVIATWLALLSPGFAQERIQVVTTTTDLRSLTEAVGGDRIAAVNLVPASMDAEDYQPKPQDVLRLKNAHMLVRVGLDYDLWIDRLLAQAGKREIRRGGPGYVDASFAIAVLELRGMSVGPGDGHAHGSGNPHYWLDPKNAEIITGTILEALARIDPANAARYEANRLAFLARLRTKLVEWEAKLAPFKSTPIVAYHNSWPYFARRFRLDFVGFIETKPGVPPSPAHLAGIVKTMRERGVRIVVREPHEPERDVAFVASKAGASVVMLAASVGALPEASDYISLFDVNVEALKSAAAPMIDAAYISLAGIPGGGVSGRYPRLFRHPGPRAQSHLCRSGACADRGAWRDSRLHARSSGAELGDLWLFARVHIACGRTAGLHAGLGHARAAGGADRGDLRRRGGGGHPAHRSGAARRRTSQANSDRKYSHQRP